MRSSGDSCQSAAGARRALERTLSGAPASIHVGRRPWRRIRVKLAAMRYAAVALLVACSGGAAVPAHPVDDAAARPLGMNDVSMLLPLPRELGAPVIAALGGPGGEQIDRRWFDALVTARGDIAPRTGGPVAFEDFHVVGV